MTVVKFTIIFALHFVGDKQWECRKVILNTCICTYVLSTLSLTDDDFTPMR